MNEKESWHLSKSIPVSFILAILIQTVTFTWWASNLDAQVKNNSNEIKSHKTDVNLHMSIDEKINTFVPRNELNQRLTSIDHSLNEIKQEIRAMREK